MEILKIYLEEQSPIKYCVRKHLTLLKIQNMMNITNALLQWFTNFLIKGQLCLYGQRTYGQRLYGQRP